MKDQYDIAVVHGDGIGPEICKASLTLLDSVLPGGVLRFTEHPAGAEHFLKTGESLPQATYDACAKADAVLHGAAGIPGVVGPDGTEVGVDFTLKLRFGLDLYANIRPIRLFDGVTGPLCCKGADKIDYVILRENSEGLYASRGGGTLLREEVATDTLVQTRKGIRRIVHKAFQLARLSNGAPADGVRRVTCCDKANVLRSYAFFRSVFDDVAKEYPDIECDYAIVDAMTMHMVLRPNHYNIIVTENMFGDILSDLGAATVGGLGLAPSAEVGDNNGLFQPSHGSAPDIAGQGVANPYGMVLSSAAMLDWLALRYEDQRLLTAATQIKAACAMAMTEGCFTPDLGGDLSTTDVVDALIDKVKAMG